MGMAQTVAQKESVMPKYVERRGNVLWFRRRAPPPLKPGDLLELDGRTVSVHANGYIHFSLKTSDIKEARVLARKYAHLCDKAAKNDAATADAATADTGLKRTRQGIVWPAKSGELTAEEIRFAAQSMYVDLLGADENTFNKEMERAFDKAFRSIEEGEEGEEGEDDDDERVSDRNEWSSADLPPMTPLGQAELIRRWRNSIYLAVLVFTGKRLEELSPKLLPFADAIRRFVRDMERRKAAEVVPTPEMPHKGEVWTWQQTFDYYFQQRAHLGEATLCNYRIAWKSLAEFASGIPAGLTREKVVEWRDKLCTQVARLTAKNRLTNVAAIWRESLVNGKIPPSVPDPFAGLRVRIDGRTGTSRQEFDKAELKALFSSPPVSTPRGVSVHAGYWLPLLALFHGARLDEIAGLEVRDIEDWGDSLVLHIRENTIRPHLKHKKLSERSTPVHPKLIALGFKDYVKAARKAKVERLFPSFTRGATFGEAYVVHCKTLLKPVEARMVGMHCLRHSWETARRNGRLDASAAQYITGRKMEKGSAADYGSQAGFKVLLSELSKITYPLKFAPAPEVSVEQLKQQDVVRMQALRAKKGFKTDVMPGKAAA